LKKELYKYRADFDRTYGYPTFFFTDQSKRISNDTFLFSSDYFAPLSLWRKSYREARNKWEDRNIKDYIYVYQNTGFPAQAYRYPRSARIQNGEVVSFTVDGDINGANVPAPPTIDGLFKIIKDALDKEPSMLQVTYNNTFHFPSSIFVDQSERMADEEIRLDVLSFAQTQRTASVCLKLQSACEAASECCSGRCISRACVRPNNNNNNNRDWFALNFLRKSTKVKPM